MRSDALNSGQELEWITRSYDQVQRLRVQTGERVAMAVQRLRVEGDPNAFPNVLQQIQRYRSEGPVPVLGRLYRRLYEQEKHILSDLGSCVTDHAAWGWLGSVSGVGPLMAAKLLGLLDVRSADSFTVFWERCGLATIPAAEYACGVCGLKTTLSSDRYFSGKHSRPDTQQACTGRLERVEAAPGLRKAQGPGPGREADYDAEAKRTCYLIGMSFLRAGGSYARYYHDERANLDLTRPTRPEGRKELTAMRKMEKLFLIHLWRIWREAEGFPVPPLKAKGSGGQRWFEDPWQMVAEPSTPHYGASRPTAAAEPAAREGR